MIRPRVDWHLYLVTDRALSAPRSVEEIVASGIRGGVTAVQYRDKEASTRQMIKTAIRLAELTRAAGIPLIINDRVDVALAVGADGVHVGQTDMPPAHARRILGPHAIVGLSIETIDDLLAAEKEDVDYYGVSPVFCTPTKAELTRAWGLDGLRAARRLTQRPLIAIGGINSSNAREVIVAGADGIAVVSAICAAEQPEIAAGELREIVRGAKGELHEPA